jgi:ankyrin repeat protein
LISGIGGYVGFVGAGFLMTPAAPATVLVGFFSFCVMAVGSVLCGVDNCYDENHRGWTLLQFAAETGAIDVADFLLKNNAKRTGTNGMDYIEIATRNGQTKFVHFFLSKKINTLVRKVNDPLDPLNSFGCDEINKLKNEISDLNKVIRNFEDFKTKAEGDIIKLIEKYQRLSKEYKNKTGETPPITPRM